MSDPKEPVPLDDAALADYLRGNSTVSQHYRALPDDVPPPALDRQVLAQARAAIGAKNVVARPRWLKWGAPMAVAASAVMALSIVMQGGLQEAELALPTRMTEEAAAPAAIEPDAAQQPLAEAAPEQEATIIDFSATNPLPPPELPIRLPSSDSPAVQAQSAQQRDQAAKETDAREVAADKRRVLSSPARAQREHERSAAPASAVRADVPLATQSARSVAPPPPVAAPAAAPPAPPAVMSAAPVAPEAWLSEIRRLRLDGDVATADGEWQRFRKAFPEYVVTDADPARPANCRGSC